MSLAITWYDNAAFKIIYNEKTLWFDPSINKNPDSPIKTSELNERSDFVFTTHGDPGHFVNSVEVAQKTGALFLGPEELCHHVLDQKQMEKERVIPLSFEENRIINGLEVYVFEAEHPMQSEETLKIIAQWGGVNTRNAGFIVRTGQITLCHLGDVVFSDVFQRIGRQFSVNVGMIPIQGKKKGDTSLEEAVESGVKIIQSLKPSLLFPVIQYTKQTNRIEHLKRRVAELQIQTRIIFDEPGKEHIFKEYNSEDF